MNDTLKTLYICLIKKQYKPNHTNYEVWMEIKIKPTLIWTYNYVVFNKKTNAFLNKYARTANE